MGWHLSRAERPFEPLDDNFVSRAIGIRSEEDVEEALRLEVALLMNEFADVIPHFGGLGLAEDQSAADLTRIGRGQPSEGYLHAGNARWRRQSIPCRGQECGCRGASEEAASGRAHGFVFL